VLQQTFRFASHRKNHRSGLGSFSSCNGNLAAFSPVLPSLNAFTPAGTFLHVSNFSINLWGKYLCYAILAITWTSSGVTPVF
jgi:hypothetical protein